MVFWNSSSFATRLKSLQASEDRLLELSSEYGPRPEGFTLEQIDTEIPASVVPLKNPKESSLRIHGIKVASRSREEHVPLVMVHGYMNGAAYYYRNWNGLSHFFSSIYSIDLLGWGQSSRPAYRLKDDSIATSESFFVESLEAWRSKRGIDRMVLAGHSMGGYLSVAYCERYPERVDKLILISPVGVPEETKEIKAKRGGFSVRRSIFSTLFGAGVNPCSAMRWLPESKGKGYFTNWTEQHLQDSPTEEKETVANYLYQNCTLPGSGEHCVSRLLNMFAYAQAPTLHRIPELKVSSVSFLYGTDDWMDSRWAVDVKRMCEDRRNTGEIAPSVSVYKVKHAGHMLLMENWKEFNAGIVLSSGGKDKLPADTPLPKKLSS